MQDERSLFNPLDLDVSRSSFYNSPTRSGTCMAGRLIPAWSRPLMPGTGINMNLRALFKMSTPVYPTMDRLFADVYFFFTPNRLVMSRRYGTPDLNDSVYSWAYFIGAQDNLLNMPLPQNGANLPTVSSSGRGTSADYRVNSLADYFDYVPALGSSYNEFNPFDLLSYFAIWNENFREPSTQAPVTWTITDRYFSFNLATSRGNWLYINKTEATEFSVTNSDNLDYLWCNPFPGNPRDVNFMLPLPTSIFHGYLGSMLPWPQRNTEGVALPLGDIAPVVSDANVHSMGRTIRFGDVFGNEDNPYRALSLDRGEASLGPGYFNGGSSVSLSDQNVDHWSLISKSNLVTDLSQATAANVNALRAAIQKQRWYEKLARSGNRYDELEYGTFGVRPKDSGNDRPVYLGGKRIELSIEMVASTNGGGDTSSSEGSGSLGSLGAFSHTNDSDHMFSGEFDDWGTLSCVFTIRHHLTLGSGTDRHKLKVTRDEYYFPTFAHLGEQSTWYGEISDVGGAFTSNAKGTIGYQQAWEEERTDVDRVSGLLRPGQSLAFMTYAESHNVAYSNWSLAQFLNASRQIAHIDNTLAVSSIASGFQFIYQLTFDYTMRAPIPVYSIPGLMDHF